MSEPMSIGDVPIPKRPTHQHDESRFRRSTDESVTATEQAHVNIVRIEVGKETLIIVLALTIIIGACGIVIGLNISEQHALAREFERQSAQTNERLQDLQRQYRMTELKLDDWTVVAHRSGLQLPGDYTRGPQGALDSESFHIQKPKGK